MSYTKCVVNRAVILFCRERHLAKAASSGRAGRTSSSAAFAIRVTPQSHRPHLLPVQLPNTRCHLTHFGPLHHVFPVELFPGRQQRPPWTVSIRPAVAVRCTTEYQWVWPAACTATNRLRGSPSSISVYGLSGPTSAAWASNSATATAVHGLSRTDSAGPPKPTAAPSDSADSSAVPDRSTVDRAESAAAHWANIFPDCTIVQI